MFTFNKTRPLQGSQAWTWGEKWWNQCCRMWQMYNTAPGPITDMLLSQYCSHTGLVVGGWGPFCCSSQQRSQSDALNQWRRTNKSRLLEYCVIKWLLLLKKWPCSFCKSSSDNRLCEEAFYLCIINCFYLIFSNPDLLNLMGLIPDGL